MSQFSSMSSQSMSMNHHIDNNLLPMSHSSSSSMESAVGTNNFSSTPVSAVCNLGGGDHCRCRGHECDYFLNVILRVASHSSMFKVEICLLNFTCTILILLAGKFYCVNSKYFKDTYCSMKATWLFHWRTN